MRILALLATLTVAGCASVQPAGTLEVLRPTTIQLDDGEPGAATTLSPGDYAVRLRRQSRSRLSFVLGTSAESQFEIELHEGAEEFPTRGGVFAYSPDAHNQPFRIVGEIIPWVVSERPRVERARCGTEIYYVTECYAGEEEGEIVCRQVPRQRYRYQEIRYIQVDEALDIGMTFLDPDTSEALGRYFESFSKGTRRTNVRRGICR